MAKYNNVKIEGYDSKKEYRRAKELKLLEKKGIITGLQEQVKYELISPQYRFYEVQGVRKMLRKKELLERGVYYIADFVYYRDGEYVVEDTKGVRTKEYIIKRKLMLYVHGIRIKEVYNGEENNTGTKKRLPDVSEWRRREEFYLLLLRP